jgi:serine protease Do
MNQPLLKISGSVCLMFLLHTSGFAQDEANKENDTDSGNRYDEIIIRHKSDKDAKVTVEIKDGQVLVDGKPVSDFFEDSTILIHRRKMRTPDGDGNFSFTVPDRSDFLSSGDFDGQAMARAFSPFRGDGAFGYSGDDIRPRSNRSFLGVTSEKPSDGEGARVINISKGSAAEKSGLRSGDVITKVDDMDVTDPQSLTDAVRQHQPGEKIAITFSRDGKVQKDSVTLGKSRTVQAYGYGYGAPDLKQLEQLQDLKQLGQLQDLKQLQQFQGMPHDFNLTFGNPLKFGIRAQDTEDGKGVKVLDVDDESTAAKAGIKEGDIITRFDGKEINSATALTEAAHAAREKASVKITLIRDGKTQEVEVHVPKRLRTADL